MTEKKAIEILKRQKEKVENKTSAYGPWRLQTASYIKDFFGFDSPEYSYVSQFSFSVVHHGLSNDKLNLELESKRRKVTQFLNDCIETIENKGLYKPPKKNFLSDKSDFQLLIWGVPLLISIFLAGMKFSSFFLPKFTNSDPITNDIGEPINDTDRNSRSNKIYSHDSLKFNDSIIKNTNAR